MTENIRPATRQYVNPVTGKVEKFTPWTVPEHPLAGFIWYQPGEKFNPVTGRPIMCTF